MHVVAIEPTFGSFRAAARMALAQNHAPEFVHFSNSAVAQQQMLGFESTPTMDLNRSDSRTLSVPKAFVTLAERVALHRDDGVWNAMYRVLYRIVHGESSLLDVATDPDMRALDLYDTAVRRDIHKMHAFVRFRRAVAPDGKDVWVSFYEPDHRITERAAAHFVDRFGDVRFVLATPDATFSWDAKAAHIGPGAPDEASARRAFFEDRQREDGIADLFCAYYDHVFNPARLNIKAMKAEMPERFWKHLPEAQSIRRLTREANERQTRMLSPHAAERVAVPPPHRDIEALRRAAADCRICEHAACATQTVFGHGPLGASWMLVGEQPGDEEDLVGLPFQGPAGRLLQELLAEAHVTASELYITNAVKHFSFEQRGKRRLHLRPHQQAVRACRPWLDAEIAWIKPQVIMCLGATAAQSFLGPGFRINQALGKWLPQPWAKAFLVSYHPSAILRMEAGPARDAARAQLVADLRRAQQAATDLYAPVQ